MKKVSIMLLLAFAVMGCGSGKAKKAEQSEANVQTAQTASYQFAISNKDGSKFLVESEEGASFEELVFAVSDGKLYRVKLIGRQQRNEENDNGRQNFENFENLQGALFENLDGKILPSDAEEYEAVWGTILLVNQGYLDENELVSFSRPEEIEEPGESTIEALEKQFGRKVMQAQKVISFGDNRQNSFFSVQFENKGNEALGIYMTETADGKRAYMEFPATFESNEDGYALSVWRVDDDGQFIAPAISAVFKQGDSYVFLSDDSGFEGTHTSFIRQTGDRLIADEESSYSRYTAPL
ncbi:MAG: hypothetical protein GX125_03425 [Bacteroidales bacterium]|jgi:hypothetical protein|nr:hypothetical protein [Bacteroidota bacterium]NLN99302.1 hypothetical protein [Bacteroidales bacterium]